MHTSSVFCRSFLFFNICFFSFLPLQNGIAQQSISDFAVRSTIDFTVKERNKNTYKLRSKNFEEFTFLSERSTRKTTFTITEHSVAELKELEATFNRKGLSDRRFSVEPEPFDDTFLSGKKNHSIYIPVSISRGDHFAYSYSLEYKDIAFFPIIYIPANDSIAEFKITLNLPEDVRAGLHFIFPRDSVPFSIDSSETKKIVITFEHLAQQKSISYLPLNNFHAALLVTLHKDTTEITPTSPESFLQWYAQRTPLLPQLDSAQQVEVKKTIATSGNEFDRIKSIYKYITGNIRYIADERGLSAYIPRPPSFILEKKYGDCKDKSALSVALSQLNGTHIHLALVATEPRPEFAQPHVNEFNHVVCAATINNHTFFFDPTATDTPFGHLPESLIGARAFILDPDHPRFAVISASRDTFSIEIDVTGSIDSLEKTFAFIKLRNEYGSAAREAFRETTREKWKLVVQEIISSNLFQIRLSNFEQTCDDSSTVTIKALADLSKFVVASASKLYFPQTPFTTNVPLQDIHERLNDSLPLYIRNTSCIKLSLHIETPGYSFSSADKTILTNSQPWYFSTKGYKTEKVTTFQYELITSDHYLEHEKKNSFLLFLEQLILNRKNKFILTRTQQ